jgi:hypothetical protein
LFASRVFGTSGGVVGLTLRGNKESCPYCGHLADMADGVFDFTEGALRLVAGPDVTRDMLQRFGELIAKAYEVKMEPSAIEEAADLIDPKLGEAVRRAREGAVPFWVVMIVMLYLLTKCELNLNVNLDVNQLISQVQSTTPAVVVDEWNTTIRRERE